MLVLSQASLILELPMTETRDKDGILDAREAGAFLRAKLVEKGWQIQQLAERTTVPDPDYLSNLLSGRINPAKSKHLKSIAAALDLTPDDIRYLNPNLIIEVVTQRTTDDVTQVDLPIRDEDWPPGLREMIEQYSPVFEELRDTDWQMSLLTARFRGPGPQTVDDWLDYFRLVRRYSRRK